MWAEFALRPDIQSLAQSVNAFQVPSNQASSIPAEAPNFDELKLIDYDFAKYGSVATRRHLLQRWDDEIKSLAR